MPCPSNVPLRILQVSAHDLGGGAQNIAWNLFEAYRRRGYASWLAVGCKGSLDPDVLEIPRRSSWAAWAHLCWVLHGRLSPLEGRAPGVGRLRYGSRVLAGGWHGIVRATGREDFGFPGSWRLLGLPPHPPDIVHAHNLHGDYFDLRALPQISHQAPLVLTLHDAWLLSGHCAHSLGCQRWTTGCGQCPDLTLYPAIERDATGYNWRRKQDIYRRSRLYVATPSMWLMNQVRQSMLTPAIAEARVIPNGVDLATFHPGQQQVARAALGIPPEAKVLLFAANGIQRNIWKDYATMRGALLRVTEEHVGKPILFIGLGEDAPSEWIGQTEMRFVPYQHDVKMVACYYRSADLYVHAARADTFPTVILEALACGTPVVATAVGGIPEQVRGLQTAGVNGCGPDEATGFLVPPGDAAGMAWCIQRLLEDEELSCKLGANAARDARQRFDLESQAERYLAWYQEILKRC